MKLKDIKLTEIINYYSQVIINGGQMAKEKTRPDETSFIDLLKEKYNEVIKEHGNFKSIVWNGKEKTFTVNL